LAELKEYKPGTAFNGVIGRTFDVSEPAWPEPLRARKGAPNVLFIILDDTGFGQLGCYGGPLETPNIDQLAAGGLLFNNMHTTALCSPTRSCIVTGRNHHSNAMSCITEGSTGYPGGNGNIPFENGFLSEILLQHGYSTFAVYNVLPVDSRGVDRLADERPRIAEDRTRYMFFPNTQAVPSDAGPRLLNRTHSTFDLSGDVIKDDENAMKVIMARQ
jgi:hypothetical protein